MHTHIMLLWLLFGHAALVLGQGTRCLAPRWRSGTPVAECIPASGNQCRGANAAYVYTSTTGLYLAAAACCKDSRLNGTTRAYGSKEAVLKDGTTICGVRAGRSPPPFTCVTGTSFCSCWVPDQARKSCVKSSTRCFGGSDVFVDRAACCEKFSNSAGAATGECRNWCRKATTISKWTCTSLSRPARKLPRCTGIKLNAPICSPPATRATTPQQPVQHTCGTDNSTMPSLQGVPSSAIKGLLGPAGLGPVASTQAPSPGQPPNIANIDVYINIVIEDKDPQPSHVWDSQMYALVDRMNKVYRGRRRSDNATVGFSFTLKAIQRWQHPEANWAWIESLPLIFGPCTDNEDGADGIPQSTARFVCVVQWKRHMRNTLVPQAQLGARTLMLYFARVKYIGLFGIATFPWEARKLGASDGVTCDITEMLGSVQGLGDTLGPGPGTVLRGETAIHEVGHWLGLYHPFQGAGAPHVPFDCSSCCPGNDLVDDTPVVQDKFQSQFADKAFLCGSKTVDTCPGRPGFDLMDNFMDYTWECGERFTPGQMERMRTMFTRFRFNK